jgi:hypothetical protein
LYGIFAAQTTYIISITDISISLSFLRQNAENVYDKNVTSSGFILYPASKNNKPRVKKRFLPYFRRIIDVASPVGKNSAAGINCGRRRFRNQRRRTLTFGIAEIGF